jgi:hypothetical protein
MTGDLLRRAATVACSLALVAVSPTAASAAKDKPLVTVGGKTVALDVDARTVTQRVGVTVAPGVQTGDLRARVARVNRGSSRRDDYVTAFDVKFVPRAARPDGLVLTVTTSKLARPGTYTVTLRVVALRKGKLRRVTRVVLKVVVRPARLAAPAAIKIHRTRRVWKFSDPQLDGAPSLRNRSLHTWLSRLHASVVEGPTQDGHPARGDVTFADGSYAPGDRGTLQVDKADLPIGTASGTLELDAPELDGPLRIPFEVVTTFPDWVIIAIVLAGLLLGTLVRTTLGILDRQTHTRAAANWLRERVDREIDQEVDEELRKKLQLAQTQLPEEHGWRRLFKGAATIAAATKEASTTRDLAYADYGERHETARADLDPLLSAVTGHSRVGDVQGQFIAARKALEDARRKLDGRDVKGATADVDAARLALVPGMENATHDWAAAASLLIGTIQTTSATDGLADRDADAATLISALDTVPPQAPAGDDVGATAAKAANLAAAAIEPFVRAAIRAAVAKSEAAIGAIAGEAHPDAAADRAALTAASNALRGGRWDHSSVIGALSSQLASVGLLLDSIAATYTVALAAPPVLSEADGHTRAAVAASTPAAIVAAAQADAAQRTPVAAPKAAEQPMAFEAPSAAGIVVLLAIGLLRFVVLAVVLSLVGYFIFKDGFQGTWSQMINVFVWAFFTDVALSTVQTLRARLPGAPSASATTGGTATS